ncbi:ATP-binding protein [Erysipelothrix sp. HDW6C]|uniref:ATP-binding protein n=1 Tax=Erysipelothrix sp. HDW6C TaxID=2714930 RepID=UPI00140C777C|nr:ATP-binding protein [Erysipelothrix sp. HDW6C]QIK70206.1 ATP-binding protein [Erysipelothrix sp. HDW6C]
MSFKKMVFELTPEQIEARNQLGATLLEQPEIQLFMEMFDCPETVIIDNAAKFKRWVMAKRDAQKHSKHDIQANQNLGRFVDLTYDKHTGIITEVISELSIVHEIAEEEAYLHRYQIFDLPLSAHKAHFELLDYKKENENFRGIMSKLMKLATDKELGYFIYGDLGVGKSFLAACATNAFAKRQQQVAYIHVPTLMSHLKQMFNSPGSLEYTLRKLRNVSLLVLDDLGAEPVTMWSRDEILLSILNDRLENKRKTIITSNYQPEMLVDLYKLDSRGTSDEIRARRLVDRIHALTKPYEMVGENRRIR